MDCHDVDLLKFSMCDVALCSIGQGSPAATPVHCDHPIDEYSVPDLMIVVSAIYLEPKISHAITWLIFLGLTLRRNIRQLDVL